jgi:hypothetical protein
MMVAMRLMQSSCRIFFFDHLSWKLRFPVFDSFRSRHNILTFYLFVSSPVGLADISRRFHETNKKRQRLPFFKDRRPLYPLYLAKCKTLPTIHWPHNKPSPSVAWPILVAVNSCHNTIWYLNAFMQSTLPGDSKSGPAFCKMQIFAFCSVGCRQF